MGSTRPAADSAGAQVVSQAGGLLLCETVGAVGLDGELSAALAPWRRPLATHDQGKIVCDLALTLALGGDCLADVALLRAEPGLYGRVASDPTVSRAIDALAADAPRALAAIHTARATPAPTPPPTTSPPSVTRCANCPHTAPAPGPDAKCSSAPTPQAPPTSCWTG